MSAVLFVFDLMLLVGLGAVAWHCLTSTDLFRAVVLFIALGLLLAMAWVRLEAPDIALAEAAIGAGVTGALLLITLERLKRLEAAHPAGRDEERATATPARSVLPVIVMALAAALGLLLAWALLAQPETAGLQPLVDAQMHRSGVDNPVTGVLLNFRAYDTFLELAVIVLALLGAWSLGRYESVPARPVPGPMLPGILRFLTPVAIVTAVYLLWAGGHEPGGAFQAGAVLAAAGILIVLGRPRHLPVAPGQLLRLGLVAGLALFLAIGLYGLLFGPGFMGYVEAWAYPLILAIEVAATLSIALTLVALFIGGRPPGEDR
ncbi:MAG: hydrogenase subunit MbhD domain-containing protein [Guyparkeria sp.]|uniref:hydrogenase subunit MbhD domain-containing protein n=1 Tax=Guyparkeria sp. TaxID=2035736 RepID=UPI0039791336